MKIKTDINYKNLTKAILFLFFKMQFVLYKWYTFYQKIEMKPITHDPDGIPTYDYLRSRLMENNDSLHNP
jgi:hypothetical protein